MRKMEKSRLLEASWTSILVLFLAFAATAHADDDSSAAESKAKIDSVKPANKTEGAEVVDDMITNNNLRALSGSLSKWSIASQFNYLGGTINHAFSEDRPDISGASGTTLKSDIDGSISVKYNINGKNALLAGFGVRWIAPLQPAGPTNYSGTTYDAMNPYITYQYVYKWLGIQSVLQAQFTQWTQADQTYLGYDKQLNIDQENMYELGRSGLSIGVSTQVQYQTFNRNGQFFNKYDGQMEEYADNQSLYLFTAAPELEYQLTEKINLRTLVNVWTFEHYRGQSDDPYALIHDNIYQSIGVGFSVTRDIFLYPNVQFLPKQIASNLTNVGVSATINLF